MAYTGLDAKKLLQNVANSQVLSGQEQPPQQDQLAQQQQQPNQQNTTGLVQPTTSQPSQSSQVQSNIPKPAPSSGSFTNLQQYVQKNQPGAQKLAGAVQQNLQTAAERARKDISQTQQKFGTELESSSLQGRDTAVQEALKVAQKAAGGVQAYANQQPPQQTQLQSRIEADSLSRGPINVDENTLPTRKITTNSIYTGLMDKDQISIDKATRDPRYGQQIEQLQAKVQQDQARLDAAKKSQEQYQEYSANVPIYNQIQSYLNEVNKTRGSLHGSGKVNQFFRDPAQARAMAGLIMNTQDPFAAAGQGGSQAMINAFNSQDFINKAASILGGSAKYYQDFASGAANAVDPNSDMIGVYGLSAAPKYADRSKEIAGIQDRLTRQQQDIDLYTGLSKIAPKQQDIPDILKQASQFGGDVSEQRFKDIINAAYKGPGNLYDIQGYENALANTREANRRLGMLGERGIQGELLDTTFKGKRRDYTGGLRGLDQLLLGTPDKLQQLQQTKKDIGSVQGTMSQAENLARVDAKTRTDLINQIRQDARGNVQNVAGARAGQVENRLAGVLENWDKLPQYFRDAIGKGTGNVKLSDVEAAILGVESGEGLYNTIRDLGSQGVIKTAKADRDALVSKAEQGQLAELQRLAQMNQDYGVQGSGLDFRSAFQDANKAGTQTAFDALDSENLRRVLNEAEGGFRESAAKSTAQGTGVGHDRYKSGFKSRDVWIRKDLSANVKDVLAKSGYDFNRPMSEQVSNPELIKALGTVARGDELDVSKSPGLGDVALNTVTNSPGGLTDTAMEMLGLGKISPTALANLGLSHFNNVTGIAKDYVPGAKALSAITGVDAVAGLAGNFFGSGKGNAQRTAAANAQRQAEANLQANLQGILNQQGFTNRLAVDANDLDVRNRRLALAQTLAGIDPTNTKDIDSEMVQNPFAENQDLLQLARRINSGYRRT